MPERTVSAATAQPPPDADELTVPGHDRNDIWVNILNAPDGGWGLGGVAYTGDDLIAAVSAG